MSLLKKKKLVLFNQKNLNLNFIYIYLNAVFYLKYDIFISNIFAHIYATINLDHNSKKKSAILKKKKIAIKNASFHELIGIHFHLYFA